MSVVATSPPPRFIGRADAPGICFGIILSRPVGGGREGRGGGGAGTTSQRVGGT